MWHALLNFLASLGMRRHTPARAGAAFPMLDVEALRRDLRLVETAVDRGHRELPFSEIARLDETEQRIAERVKQSWARAHEDYSYHLHTYSERLHASEPHGYATEVRIEETNAEADFRTAVQSDGLEIQALEDEAIARDAELAAFRAAHGLTRRAHYPASRLLHVALLAAMLMTEAVLNGQFLALGHELGLLGGVSSALVIAVINVICGFAVGRLFMPGLFHRNAVRKVVSAALCSSYVILSIIFNLAVAHYRDALGGSAPDMAAALALTTLKANPLAIADVQSWLLAIMGLVFSLAGALDGLRWDDRYPEYGRIDRAARKGHQDVLDALLHHIDELQALKDEAIAQIRDVKVELERRCEQYQSIADSRDRYIAAYRAHCEHLESVANTLLGIYREENCRARSTPAPAHFAVEWALPMGDEPSGGTVDAFTGTRMESVKIETNEELDLRIEKLIAEFDRARDTYGPRAVVQVEAHNNDDPDVKAA